MRTFKFAIVGPILAIVLSSAGLRADDLVISGHVRETNNAPIGSAQMVYGDPETLDQAQQEYQTGFWFEEGIERWQEFRPAANRLCRIDLLISRVGDPGNIVVTVSGPGDVVLKQVTILMSNVPAGQSWISATVAPALTLVPQQLYKIRVRSTMASAPGHIYYWDGTGESSYSRGGSSVEDVWPGFDFAFRTYSGDPPVATNEEGFYEILVSSGWSGTVTPIKTGYDFAPASRSFANLQTSSYDQDYMRTNTTAGVTTVAITDITTTTAEGGGTVLADGGAAVTARGVCWSLAQNPTTADPHTTDGTGTGTFASSLTSLTPNTPYYVRAYATNSFGTAYGEELVFTTAQITFTLALTAGGAGGGTVRVGETEHDLPFQGVYILGTQLVIEALPAQGSEFSGWTGDLVSSENPATVTMDADKSITAGFGLIVVNPKDDLVGTWDGQGVYYRNSETGAWVKLASPATKITVGDLDGDEIDDLIGLWPGQGGIWVKYSHDGTWVRLSSTAQYIASGDMNGDGRIDLVGTWDGQGVYYRNSITGAWVKMASPATMVTAGDIDDDGTDDLIGLWPSQGGIWVKYSQTGAWAKLSSTAVHIASGDMNGDGRDDLLGTWDGQGVYYRDSVTGSWVKMASPANLITTGDIDGDATDDLAGIWPTQGGVWVKYSGTGAWALLSSTAQDISAGRMRAATIPAPPGEPQGEAAMNAAFELPLPMGGNADGPETASKTRDLSDRGPGGARFVYLEDINLEPEEAESVRLNRVPGPGERGFLSDIQENIHPGSVAKEILRRDHSMERAKKKK